MPSEEEILKRNFARHLMVEFKYFVFPGLALITVVLQISEVLEAECMENL